MAAASAGKAY